MKSDQPDQVTPLFLLRHLFLFCASWDESLLFGLLLLRLMFLGLHRLLVWAGATGSDKSGLSLRAPQVTGLRT